MHYVIVSDLHLGAGDDREDFLLWGDRPNGPTPVERPAAMAALDATFARFLDGQRAAAHEQGLAPHLLMLGDVLDLWQARQHREPWSYTLVRVLQAHPGFVAALRSWIADGGQLTWVVGNHDQPVVDRASWEVVREVFSTINAHAAGAPVHYFADPGAGLYAEHGHRWDPFNRILHPTKPDADCLGFRIVRLLVNQLEPFFPLVDKGADLVTLLELLWEAAQHADLPGFEKVAPEVIRWIGRASRPACALIQELEHFLARRERPDFARVGAEQSHSIARGIRRGLEGRRGALTGPAPDHLRFFVSGHTHHAHLTPVRTRAHGEVVVMNPGSWRPVAKVERRDGQTRISVTQEPGAIILSPSAGAWEARPVTAPLT